MRWDRFFEDLEDQLDSEWEAERAALDTETERLRLARVPARDRLVAMTREGREVSVALRDADTVIGRVTRVGADWIAVLSDGAGATAVIVPLHAVVALGAPIETLLASVRDADAGPAIAERMGIGFVLRDLVRRRIPVTLVLVGGASLHGTIDRAGADHLDLALHEPGSPRRASSVSGYRLVPFDALVAVRLAEPGDLA